MDPFPKQSFRIEARCSDENLTEVAFLGELDASGIPDALDRLKCAAPSSRSGVVLVDLSGLTFLSVSAISALAGSDAADAIAPTAIRFHGAVSPAVRRVLGVTQAGTALAIYETRAAAMTP